MRKLLTFILSTGFIASAQAQTFSQVVAFGDSLSDVGNVSDATLGIAPGGDYFSGRYSNGPLWVDWVANNQNVTIPLPSRMGGKNYAHAGVITGGGNTNYYIFFNFPNVGTQINSYLGNNTASPTALYTVWGGGNDLMDNLSINTQVVVNNLVSHVTALNDAGARFVVVPNLPPLGEIPKYRNTSNRNAYDQLSATFNLQLKNAMTSLDSQLPIKIYQLDVAQMFTDVLGNPAPYGLTNITSPALSNGNVAPNQDEYLFWDDVHPTRIGHAQLGLRATDLLATHDWIGTSGSWNVAGNWDYAGTPAASWIASMNNTSATPKEATLQAASTVRQLKISAATSQMKLTLTPGATLTATQSVELKTGGAIRFEIAGDDAQSQGHLNVNGSISLAGQIEIAGVNGFITLPGSSYTILDYQSRSGDATIVNATGYAGLSFDKTYSATALTLTARATAGDADLNGLVNSVDFNAFINGYGSTNANWLAGDFTFDAKVNTLDFNLLAANFGVASALLGTVVPEPVSMSLMIIASMLMRRNRR